MNQMVLRKKLNQSVRIMQSSMMKQTKEISDYLRLNKRMMRMKKRRKRIRKQKIVKRKK